MSETTTDPAGSGLTPKRRGSLVKRLVLGVAGFAVVAGGAVGGFLWWQASSAHAEGTEATAPVAEARAEPNAVLPLEPFVVNLSDTSGSRFLRVTLRLLLVAPRGVKEAKNLTEDEVAMARLRSALLELLSTQTADELVTAEGKDALKQAIVAQASSILHEVEVRDVLFSEFVVQF